MDGAAWRQEYEIDFEVEAGKKVWEDFDRTHYPYVTYDPDPKINPNAPHIGRHWPIWCGMDYGLVNPTVFTVNAMQSLDRAYQFDEVITVGKSPSEVAEILREKWYFDHISGYVGDSSIWRKHASDKPGQRKLTSVGEMFQEQGIYIQHGSNAAGIDKDYIALLNNNLWKDKQFPKWMISRDCVGTIDSYRKLQWLENKTPDSIDNNPDPEKIRNKDVDPFDANKYWHMSVPFESPEEVDAPPESFDWYMERMMRDDDEGVTMFG